MSTTRWVSESEVVSILTLSDAIEALVEGFGQEGSGQAVPLDKTMLGFDGHSTLHALGAAFGEQRLAGTKTWAHTPGGADPVLLLFDSDTGALRAVIEAFALGQLRTAGTVAVATDRLAAADAGRLAIVGTGKQALAQVAAVAKVRRLSEVRAFGPNPQRRDDFAQQVNKELSLECRPCSSVDEAIDGAEVITLVTRAVEPVLSEDMLVPGVHINAVGAIDLKRREFEPKVLARCALVVTDSRSQALTLSSELREFYGTAPDAWSDVISLGELVHRDMRRREPTDITLFKGMGSGIEDLSLGAAVLAQLSEDESVNIQRHGRSKPDLAGAPSTKRGGTRL